MLRHPNTAPSTPLHRSETVLLLPLIAHLPTGHNNSNMVTRIPNEAGPSHATTSYPILSSRRSLNPACRDVQATLSSFRFSTDTSNLSESPSSGAPLSTAAVSTTTRFPSDDDEYVEPSCVMDSGSRRPSVQRTSSAPEPSSSKSTLFVEPSGPSMLRPSLARSCSESRASGVLERRRRKIASSSKTLPSNMVLDLANLPMIMGAGNIGLLRAARKAIVEPSGFDWGRATSSAPPTSAHAHSRFLLQQEPKPSWRTPNRSVKGAATSMSLPASTTGSKASSPESTRVPSELASSQSYADSYWSNHSSVSVESEFDWALAGNARATSEALRFSAYKEKKEPVHDIWCQLPDWMSRRSSLGGRDADASLRGPGLYSAFGPNKMLAKETATATANSAAVSSAALSFLAQTTLSDHSPRSSLSGRGRVAQTKVSVHVPYRVIEELPPAQEGSLSPRASSAAVLE